MICSVGSNFRGRIVSTKITAFHPTLFSDSAGSASCIASIKLGNVDLHMLIIRSPIEIQIRAESGGIDVG